MLVFVASVLVLPTGNQDKQCCTVIFVDVVGDALAHLKTPQFLRRTSQNRLANACVPLTQISKHRYTNAAITLLCRLSLIDRWRAGSYEEWTEAVGDVGG